MISTTATMFIHLYFWPLFHAPISKRSPWRQRRKIGIGNDRYRPITAMEVTAKKAIGRIRGASAVPTLTSARAGRVTSAATTATPMTALAGTRAAFNEDQSRWPGTARSRLNANAMRDAEVRQEVAQKNCADAEMNSTSV